MQNTKFCVGDKVEANYQGRGKYLPGSVSGNNGDGTFVVLFDDGSEEDPVKPEQIRLVKPSNAAWESFDVKLEEGMNVRVDPFGKGRFVIGTVKQVRGDGTFDIVHSNGEVEMQVKKDMISIIPKVADTSNESASERMITRPRVLRPKGPEALISSLETSEDGSLLLCCVVGNSISTWNTETGVAIDEIENGKVTVACLTRDGSNIIFGTSEGTVCVWNIVSRQQICVMRGHRGSIQCLILIDNEGRVISGSADSTIRVWNVGDGSEMYIKKGHSGAVLTLCASRDKKLVASGSEDKTIRLMNSYHHDMGVFKGHTHSVHSVCFSNDAKKLISGSADRTIRIWSVSKGKAEKVLNGHDWSVRAVLLSPDGSKIVSAASDATLRVWDMNTGKELEVVRGHSNAVCSMCISADGSRVVAGTADSCVYIWQSDFSEKNNIKALPSANALNDSSRIGVDRLGFSAYAQAIYSALSEADTPVCVGLYARWGSGKSFMIQLLKYYFDKSVSVRKSTKELVQWYEEGWMPPVNGDHKSDNKSQRSRRRGCCGRCGVRMCLCLSCFKGLCSLLNIPVLIQWSYELGSSLIPDENYVLNLVYELISDVARDVNHFAMSRIKRMLFSCYDGRDYTSLSDNEFEELRAEEAINRERIHPIDEENGESKSEREHIFVDFNAWEFSRSDELWAGLIRNIYQKVELRLSQHNSDNFKARTGDINSNSTMKDNKVDWKRLWRVKKAKDLLIQHYGGVRSLRLRLLLLLGLTLGVISTVVLSILGYIDIWTRLVSGIQQALSVVAGVVGVVIAAVPSLRLLYQTNSSVNTSRGDAIFKEANRVQDSIGFLSRVRGELDELFQFMREYEAQSSTRLILVVFVDDLDRCLEGRNVKVLEAIQLILAIPGAPVIAFLAIDSRVVVASIEATINKSLSIRDALVSGYEYMDKIVQVPFCLPESSQEKVRKYIDSCIVKAADPIGVKKMADYFVATTESTISKSIANFNPQFKLSYQSKDKRQEYEVVFHDLSNLVTPFRHKEQYTDCMELVLALVALFPTTKHLVRQYQYAIGSVAKNGEDEDDGFSPAVVRLISKDEIIEQMCTSVIQILSQLKFKIEAADTIIKMSDTVTSVIVQENNTSELAIIAVLGAVVCVLEESKGFRLRKTMNHNNRAITAMCGASDGKLVVTGSENGTVVVWDLAFGKQIHVWEGSHETVSKVCITNDSKTIVSASGRSIHVWSVASGKELHVLNNEAPVRSSLCLSSSDKLVLCACNTAIRVWDLSTGMQKHFFDVRGSDVTEIQRHHVNMSDITTICMSWDDKKLFYGSYASVRILNFPSFVEEKEKEFEESSTCLSVMVSRNGKKLIASSTSSLHIYDIATGDEERCIEIGDSINCIAICPDGQRIVSSSSSWHSNSIIRMVSVNTGAPEPRVSLVEDYTEIEREATGDKLHKKNLESNSDESQNMDNDNGVNNTSGSTIATRAVEQFSWVNEHFLQQVSTFAGDVVTKASLPVDMHRTLTLLCSTSESNPRKLKRVLNVVLIAYEVAKCKYESEDVETVVVSNKQWPDFSARLTKWIFLCELYPYRMSFLVQLLVDLEQKKLFNQNQLEVQALRENAANVNFDHAESLVYYADVDVSTTTAEEHRKALSLLNVDMMNIGEFFFLHVEKYLYTISSAEKLMRLDGDPELFATLLYSTINLDKDRNLKIRCVDVLGPLKSPSVGMEGNVFLSDALWRDKNFALVTYAFNLNPSMAKQIGMEIQDIMTQFELVQPAKFENGQPSTKNEALLQSSKSVYNKRDLLIKHSNHSPLLAPSMSNSRISSMLNKFQSLEKAMESVMTGKALNQLDEGALPLTEMENPLVSLSGESTPLLAKGTY